MSKWDSYQYLKFAEERKQPCIDLLNRLNGDFNSILDLGCGPGNSTNNLKNKFPNADIKGVDIDDNMLKRAKRDYPNITFLKGNIPDFLSLASSEYDLIFSNACIHWIENQSRLINEVYGKLNDGGVFAVQIPLTEESIFYKNLKALIAAKWNSLSGINNFHNLSAEGYYNELGKKFKSVTVWKTDYYHILDCKADIIEWYGGSGLRPYLQAIDEKEREEFLADLNKTIDENYKPLGDGKVFLIMPRLFFIAQK